MLIIEILFMIIDYIKGRKRNNLIVFTYLKAIGLIFNSLYILSKR